MLDKTTDRRPIQAREKLWVKRLAVYLQQKGATPNVISIFSILFSFMAALSFVIVFSNESFGMRVVLLFSAALMIQCRLMCNLLDGMVAIEGGLRSAVGAVYNELPDRVSDSIIFVAIGYGLSPYFSYAMSLGWCAAFMAVVTAYIRLLGGSTGLPQKFLGPMAKQHRMALLTGVSIVSSILPLAWVTLIFIIALWGIVLGSFVTICNRTWTLVLDLKKRGI